VIHDFGPEIRRAISGNLDDEERPIWEAEEPTHRVSHDSLLVHFVLLTVTKSTSIIIVFIIFIAVTECQAAVTVTNLTGGDTVVVRLCVCLCVCARSRVIVKTKGYLLGIYLPVSTFGQIFQVNTLPGIYLSIYLGIYQFCLPFRYLPGYLGLPSVFTQSLFTLKF